MKKPRETIEDAIRMLVRIQVRMRREGIALHWTLTPHACEPEPKKRRGAKP